VATADFVEGPRTTGEAEEMALRRHQVQQEAVDGARLLLRALGHHRNNFDLMP
jgi:hypothetical protein